MDSFQFSVIIPTCNRPELLAKCLQQLAPGTQKLDRNCYEVIVTDDSVGNETEAMLKESFPWVRYTRGLSRGPAANRNHGAGLAKAPCLVFTDDDCIPSPGWLAAYSSYLVLNPQCAAMEGRTLAIGVRKRFDETAPQNEGGGEFYSCNIAMNTDLFRSIRGFQEAFPYAILEDVEFKERVEKHTGIAFVPEALVHHPWRRIQSDKLVNRLLTSNRVYMQVRGRSTNWLFRLNRMKLLVTCTIQNTKMLQRYRGNGFIVYLKMCQFYLAMIFLRLKS